MAAGEADHPGDLLLLSPGQEVHDELLCLAWQEARPDLHDG
jgi:hypothetical protein